MILKFWFRLFLLLSVTIATQIVTFPTTALAEFDSTQGTVENLDQSSPQVTATAGEEPYSLNLKVFSVGRRQRVDYKFDQAPYGMSNQIAFEAMTKEKQQKFLKFRRQRLIELATVLHNTRLGLGFFSVSLQKSKGVLSKAKRPIVSAYRYVRAVTTGHIDPSDFEVSPAVELAAADIVNDSREPGQSHAALREQIALKSQAMVNSILLAVDQLMWSKAKRYSESNEMGGGIIVEPIALAGKGARGEGFGIGAEGYIGYNEDSNTLYIELRAEGERYFRSSTGIINATVNWIGFAELRRRENRDPQLYQRGYSHYPPMTHNFVGENAEQFGVSGSFPPTPADAMSYSMSTGKATVIQLSFSPNQRGFVRARLGNPFKILKAFKKVRATAGASTSDSDCTDALRTQSESSAQAV